MTLAAHHSLLHGPGIRSDFQHFEIVIRFQHQQVRAAQMELDGIRQISQIRYDSDFDALGAEAETYGINGVVGDGKTVDLYVADGEGGSGLKAIEFGREFAPGNGGSG